MVVQKIHTPNAVSWLLPDTVKVISLSSTYLSVRLWKCAIYIMVTHSWHKGVNNLNIFYQQRPAFDRIVVLEIDHFMGRRRAVGVMWTFNHSSRGITLRRGAVELLGHCANTSNTRRNIQSNINWYNKMLQCTIWRTATLVLKVNLCVNMRYSQTLYTSFKLYGDRCLYFEHSRLMCAYVVPPVMWCMLNFEKVAVFES